MTATTTEPFEEMDPGTLAAKLLDALGISLATGFTSAGGSVKAQFSDGGLNGKLTVRAMYGKQVIVTSALTKKEALGVLTGTSKQSHSTWKWVAGKMNSLIADATAVIKDGALLVGVDWGDGKTSATWSAATVAASQAQAEAIKTGKPVTTAKQKKKKTKGSIAEIAQAAAGSADTSIDPHLTQGGEEVYFPKDKMKTATPVKLIDAEQVYQPVRGTNDTSRYFVMGVSDLLKVGVRYKSDTMAIRIEGSLLKNEAARAELKKFGFANVSEDYGSMHLPTGGDSTLARKLLGSVLMGLGSIWKHPLPDLGTIQGIGA